MIQPLLIEREIGIKAYDIDAMGVVSNIVYIRWFEDLRHALLDAYFSYEAMIGGGKLPLLMQTKVDYRYPLTIGEKPVGRTWVSHAGTVKWTMEFEIATADAVHCHGKQSGCYLDIETREPVPFPEDFLRLYLEDRERQEEQQRLSSGSSPEGAVKP